MWRRVPLKVVPRLPRRADQVAFWGATAEVARGGTPAMIVSTGRDRAAASPRRHRALGRGRRRRSTIFNRGTAHECPQSGLVAEAMTSAVQVPVHCSRRAEVPPSGTGGLIPFTPFVP